MQKINLLHIVGHIHPFGGLERKVMQLINHLNKDKFNVFLIGLTEYNKKSNDFLDKDIKIVFLDKKEGVDLKVVSNLYKILRENKIDIIHSHNWATLFYAVVAAKLARTPVIIHGEHGIETKSVEDSLKQLLLKKFLFRQCTHLIAVSLFIKNFLTNRYKIKSNKITLIYNGVEVNNLKENYRKKYNLNKYSTVIGTIGRIKPVKDLATLIKAFKLIKKKNPDAALVIIGPGNDDNNAYYLGLKNLIEELKITDVKFLGTFDNIPGILSTFDVFVNSSIYEGISNTILEAMSQKIPVVASKVGGTPELILNEKSGLLFKHQNEQECAICVNRIIDDEKLRNSTTNSAYQNVVQNHSMNSMYSKNINLYQNLLNKLHV